ncbi:hypothetical protein TWF694_003106 [Orbilia ellipsospora]|uniref:N-acetyltransferase domain-containing protein n=1 Tax=Orbilia ellipsospora TaxID=2528407 RepID=A0AAV9X351_9PEZI
MTLRPATPTDLPAILEITRLSLEEHAQAQFTYPNRSRYPADFVTAMDETPRKKLAESPPLSYNLVIEDPGSGKVVAWGFWRRNAGVEFTSKIAKYKELDAAKYNHSGNNNDNNIGGKADGKDVQVDFNPAASRARMQLCDRCVIRDTLAFFTQPHWYLSQLMVHPEQKRKGYGRLLTLWGMRRAREEGFPAFLTASPQGERLYTSLGWRDIGSRSFPKLEEMSEEDRRAEEEMFGKETLEEHFSIAPPRIMKWGNGEEDYAGLDKYGDSADVTLASFEAETN